VKATNLQDRSSFKIPTINLWCHGIIYVSFSHKGKSFLSGMREVSNVTRDIEATVTKHFRSLTMNPLHISLLCICIVLLWFHSPHAARSLSWRVHSYTFSETQVSWEPHIWRRLATLIQPTSHIYTYLYQLVCLIISDFGSSILWPYLTSQRSTFFHSIAYN